MAASIIAARHSSCEEGLRWPAGQTAVRTSRSSSLQPLARPVRATRAEAAGVGPPVLDASSLVLACLGVRLGLGLALGLGVGAGVRIGLGLGLGLGLALALTPETLAPITCCAA